ncbi:MAG: tRNA uridine(34) 5-carboxymethylaminomethyl modification radical SAM/GNAT enzyme Elp3 [Candidatus Thorarchaeota archaeon]
MTSDDEEYELNRAIIQALLNSVEPLTKQTINQIKNKVCGRFHRSQIPTNADVLEFAVPEEAEILRPLLRTRPVRTVSGVAVIAVMTKPVPCPHGKCAYCPGGPDLGVPQSYTGYEPATMRGIQNAFDPYNQVTSRLNQLRTIGHSVQKVELIVMGGDWCSKDLEYRREFVKGCLDAMNGVISPDLEAAKRLNETASVRNIGTTFETRPDWVTSSSIDEMLEMGATRVEIGVQTLSDEILDRVQRGHGVAATIEATKLLRDSGLKICYHMMPGLPGATPESDLDVFEQLFSDANFRPDMLKIYPTLVIKNTKLYDWWMNGEYTPYTNEQIVNLVAKAVNRMPEYVRIQRMQRDIPLHQIEAGLNRGNLRELVHREMLRLGLRNPTIRYREVGHYEMRTGFRANPASIRLVRRDYEAAGGTEMFLSVEDSTADILFGFLRLRLPSVDAHRSEVASRSCVLIRELRVYGPVVNIGERRPDAWQHLGLGERLLREAERIGREELGVDRILVLSGIGVKEYYRTQGYSDLGPYLMREL